MISSLSPWKNSPENSSGSRTFYFRMILIIHFLLYILTYSDCFFCVNCRRSCLSRNLFILPRLSNLCGNSYLWYSFMLTLIFLYAYFNIHRVSGSVFSLISEISCVISLLILVTWLEVYQFYYPSQRASFWLY